MPDMFNHIPLREEKPLRGFIVELPYPPTLNHYWKHAVIKGSVRVYVSTEGKDYRNTVCSICATNQLAGLKLTRKLSVKMEAYVPDLRKRDIDNLPKAVLDAFTAACVWLDDSQVDYLSVERMGKVKGGKIVVRIEELG